MLYIYLILHYHIIVYSQVAGLLNMMFNNHYCIHGIYYCIQGIYNVSPCKFAKSVMPEFYAVQLQNRVTRISLDQMFNYKNTPLSTDTPFKANCVKTWNNLPFDYKTLLYSSNKEGLFIKLKNHRIFIYYLFIQ